MLTDESVNDVPDHSVREKLRARDRLNSTSPFGSPTPISHALRHIVACGHWLSQVSLGHHRRQAPCVPAPTELTLGSAVACDRVPIAVGLHLVVNGTIRCQAAQGVHPV